MNHIKYVGPNGQRLSIKICQPSYNSILGLYTRWGAGHTLPTMRQADEHARRNGLVRAGLRHARKGWGG